LSLEEQISWEIAIITMQSKETSKQNVQ